MPSRAQASSFAKGPGPRFPKLRYVRPAPAQVRMLGGLMLGALGLFVIGSWRLLTLHPIMWIFAPILVVIVLHEVLTVMAKLRRPEYDFKAQRERKSRLRDRAVLAEVDVLLPVSGEPLAVLRRTWEAVARIRYANLTITVLDDSANDEIRMLAGEFGFRCLTRPNRGEHAKSGNLAYGFAHTSGEFYLVLDADFAPHPQIIEEMLPWLLEDPEVGIIQSPQYFDFHEPEVAATAFLRWTPKIGPVLKL